MRQPGATLRTVVGGTRRADFEREGLVPMHAFRAVRHVEAVLDAEARMLGLHLPSELVGADVQAAPALRVTDEAGHRHRAFHHARNLFAFLAVLDRLSVV